MITAAAAEELKLPVVLNPAAFTHYSYALHDALVASEKPGIEIHVSDIHKREEWRRAHNEITQWELGHYLQLF